MMADEGAEYGEEEEEFEDEAVVVGQLPTVMVPRHIKKRSLKNKGLTVGFDDKELRDYVTGFHKRKKKRRKEAQLQLQEKERLKRIQARKKRKEEKEVAMYGRVLSSENPIAESGNDDVDDPGQDEQDVVASFSETRTYDDSNMTITVTTSELSRENDDVKQHSAPRMSIKAEKNHSLAVKKKPLKRVIKHRSNKKGGKKHANRKKDNKKSSKKRR